ncbi:MAG: methyltransferase [Arthrospira sp. SH-MAG29]|nr:methyltransferase [Arthrospira sp. SH-MAG29]MBS0016641.1 methyltransferase [Arthrospira sp. SH-MAG29]
MGSHKFQFKQFTIFQDRCGMKVGTDGVILGTWTDIKSVHNILDIGTGSGLIALILAQRSPAKIDAVEIDKDAYIQAGENLANSPWRSRLKIHHNSIQKYADFCDIQYDLIISNPPFFANAYKPNNHQIALAKHSDSLSQLDILQVTTKLLKPTGKLAIIYPTAAAINFQDIAPTFGLYCDRQLLIKPTATHSVKRIIMELSKHQKTCHTHTLIIEKSRHIYSEEFIALIRDFYVKY